MPEEFLKSTVRRRVPPVFAGQGQEPWLLQSPELKKMRTLILALLAIALAGCDAENNTDAESLPPAEPATAPVVDMHTSQNALDWAGTYEGLLACADCAGIHTRLNLDREGRFELVTRRLVRGADASASAGRFDWEPGGNIITLTTEEQQQRFAVGEGRVLLLDPGQTQPAWGRSEAVLAQSNPAWRNTRQDPAEIIEDHRWTLVDATGAADQRLEVLFPDPERPLAFNFAESRVHVEGGCNGLRGVYRVDADGMLGVTGGMSTMMACEDPLMNTDAALAALMAEPLETVLVGGASPRLVLLASAGDTLVLTGELTPEARFGPPTTVFLEVDSQLVACEGSVRGDGLCLNVRELTFDDQGIPVGTPSEWQPFSAEIQGYRHEAGIRNVLRVKHFAPAAAADMPPGPVYVLDLVVQSEVVSQ